MIKLTMVFFGILFIAGCAQDYRFQGSPQFITDLSIQIGSVEDAELIFSSWLDSETDFDGASNKIEFIDETTGYFNLRLTRAIAIEGRENGIMGYRDYRLSKDGKMYGYYYSK